MKSQIKKLILIPFLLGALFLLHSCGEANQQTTSTASAETPDVVSASQEYADKVNQFFEAASKYDFDAMHKDYTDDAIQYWPDGDSETRSSLTGKAEIVAWWKNWKEKSGIEKMTFSNINLVPLQVNKALKYYNVVGTIVLAYFDTEQVYNGQSVKVRMHWAFAFNEDKKINRVFSYYDRTYIIEAVKANMIKSGTAGK